MIIGMIGLGRMGANMTERLVRGGHRVVCYDQNPAATGQIKEKNAIAVDSLQKLSEQLSSPRIVWMMVPAGDPVDQTIENISPYLSPGDILIDGGNSNYNQSILRGEKVRQKGLNYIDVGVSGGIWGSKEGYSMMIGGDKDIVKRLTPIFETLAPSPNNGWGYVGPQGAGHFVKMIHNGIEYGMMEAFAEGFAIMQAKKNFNLDLHHIAEIWRHGSVVRSWLLDLTADALEENPDLKGIAPYVVDSGEGRWTVSESLDLDIPAPVITLSLLQRFGSRLEDSFTNKLLAAMRNKFGGHAIKKEA